MDKLIENDQDNFKKIFFRNDCLHFSKIFLSDWFSKIPNFFNL